MHFTREKKLMNGPRKTFYGVDLIHLLYFIANDISSSTKTRNDVSAIADLVPRLIDLFHRYGEKGNAIRGLQLTALEQTCFAPPN